MQGVGSTARWAVGGLRGCREEAFERMAADIRSAACIVIAAVLDWMVLLNPGSSSATGCNSCMSRTTLNHASRTDSTSRGFASRCDRRLDPRLRNKSWPQPAICIEASVACVNQKEERAWCNCSACTECRFSGAIPFRGSPLNMFLNRNYSVPPFVCRVRSKLRIEENVVD